MERDRDPDRAAELRAGAIAKAADAPAKAADGAAPAAAAVRGASKAADATAADPAGARAGDGTTSSARLGYATNVFRGDSLDEVIGAIGGPLRRLRASIDERELAGLELRLGEVAIGEIAAHPESIERLLDALAESRLAVLTMNGFSPRGFHGREVKEEAYYPTWMEQDRITYTHELATVLARLLPPGATGAISTSPGSFKGFGHDDAILASIAEGYAEAVRLLAEIEADTGHHISLSIEPEPGCSIESTEELVSFFEEHLFLHGGRHLHRSLGVTPSEAERLLRGFLGATFDTCHLSVQFEELTASADRLDRAGIRITKVHATSGLRIERPADHPDLPRLLAPFTRSPYLHQVVGVDDARSIVLRATDLDRALADPGPLLRCDELRVHFHLPLFAERLGPLATTVEETLRGVRHILSRGLCDTVVLETYTWHVLEGLPDFRGIDVESGIAREIRWARERLFT